MALAQAIDTRPDDAEPARLPSNFDAEAGV